MTLKGSFPFNTSKTIVCVRHPLDVFPSYGALCNTVSHGNKPDFDFLVDYPEWWNWFVKRQAFMMQKYFEILIRQGTTEAKNPMYIVRYEDIVTNPKETLMGLMSFLLEVKDLTGTNMERRIDQLVSKGKAAVTTYNLKDTTGKFD